LVFIEGIALLLEQHFGLEDQCIRRHKAWTIRYWYCSPNSVSTSIQCSALALPSHVSLHLCYDGVAHVYGDCAPDKEDRRWPVSRWWT